jgi:F0F1-type ATP synthase assembly protein I
VNNLRVTMEEKVKSSENVVDENREVALGICFGSGIGIIIGAIANNVVFGLSAGGVLGILAGTMVKMLRKLKR